MVSGVNALTLVGIVVAFVGIRFLCRSFYVEGHKAGERMEALAWCNAFDQLDIPNWQTVTMDDEKDRAQKEAIHRLYVGVFRAVKTAIGQDLIRKRLEALQKKMLAEIK